MTSHLLGDFELATIFADTMVIPVARKLWQLILVSIAGGDCPALDHHVGVGLGEWEPAGQFSVPQGRKEGSGGVDREPRDAGPRLCEVATGLLLCRNFGIR
jgi:hypothetical protein